MDKERYFKDLIDEYHAAKLYHDNLMSKATHQLQIMNECLKRMKEFEDDEIR